MSQRARLLEARLLDFAEGVCVISDRLPRTRLGVHISGQLLRSGTSVAPNYAEAQSSESRKDFIHKMQLCLKELRETNVWLQLATRLRLDDSPDLGAATIEVNQLIAIFVASIKTARRNGEPPKS